VVDDGSSDRTVELVGAFSSVKLLQQQHQGPGQARNLGAQHAAGEVLVFCDADQEFDRSYVEKLIAPILSASAVGTYSREEFIANYDNVWARCYNIDAEIYTNSRNRGDTPEESPVFRAIPRALFLKIGGYDNVGYDDDHTISEKGRIFAVPAPGAVCYHHNPETLREVFAQARWYGKSRQVDKSWKTMLRYTPPVAFAGSIKRSIRTETPAFIVYKLVHSAGVLSGIVDHHLSAGTHYR
jgi:glycosyltransferase involved in cell wall biosynthesis